MLNDMPLHTVLNSDCHVMGLDGNYTACCGLDVSERCSKTNGGFQRWIQCSLSAIKLAGTPLSFRGECPQPKSESFHFCAVLLLSTQMDMMVCGAHLNKWDIKGIIML